MTTAALIRSPSSESAERLDFGRQEPRASSIPPAAWSAGGDAIDLAETALLLGEPFGLMPWQKWLIDRILGIREDGKWAARDAAYLVSRQNGKGGVLHALELAGLFLFPDVREIIHSAHETKTAKKSFRELKELIEDTPHLKAQVERRGKRITGFRESNENTSITLQDGSVIRFVARANNTGRGFSPQWIVMDEAQICSTQSRNAMFYMTRAQPNPLRIWCGTVPDPGAAHCDVFTSMRDRGRAGTDPHLLWAEWSADPDRPVESFRGDDEVVGDATPALGHLVDWETVDSERTAATSYEDWLGFCREALSWWPSGSEALPWELWPEATWLAAGVPVEEVTLADPVTLALEVSPGLEKAWIGAAGAASDGERRVVELVEVLEDTSGLVARVTELANRHGATGVVVDERSPGAVFVAALEAQGVTVFSPGTPDVVEAALGLAVGVTTGDVVWLAGIDTAEILSRAAGVAARRRSRDAWLIDRHGDPDALPLVAVSLALWGHGRPVEVEADPDFLVL